MNRLMEFLRSLSVQSALDYFDQKGGVYVGVASLLTFFFALLETFSRYKKPTWWFNSVSDPGAYGYILGLFVVTGMVKMSKWNKTNGNGEPK